VKKKLFYGWYIVVAGLLLSAYNASIFGYGWTAFVNPILATFGWSMTQLSLASSMRNLETGIFNPLWGTVVDRWPARRLMLIGLIFSALGMFCLSQTKNLAMYYIGFLIVGISSSLISGILPQTVIARWFKKDIGKASGLFYMGVGIGGVAVPLMVNIIDKLTWQTTLLYAAIGYLIIGIPLSFVFRSRPSEYGLVPDGRVQKMPQGSLSVPSSEFGTSVKEALKQRAFWHIAVVTIFQNATMATISLYAIPYLTSIGMERHIAGNVVMFFTLSSLFTRIPMGMLSDVIRKTHVVAISLVLLIVGVFLFWLIGSSSSFWMILLFAVTYGFGLGGVLALRAPVLSEYFGTKNFGTIFGFTSIFITVASVASPPLAGWIYDTSHSYKLWWLSLLIFGVVALIAILTIPRPKRSAEIKSVKS
jgi:MFS transporter, OFA family, oxalate/formate antiporter